MFVRQRRRKALAAILFVLALVLTGSSLASAHYRPALPFQPAQASYTEYGEWFMVQKINAERTHAGLQPVRLEYSIHQYSRYHAKRMIGEGRLWHDMDRYGRLVPRGTRMYAENVAFDHSLDEAHQRLMSSPVHRDNILNPRFNYVGIGIRQAPDGMFFVSENFAAVNR